MDDNALESSIMTAAEEAIKAIREKEESQIKALDEKHAVEIEAFRRRTEDTAQARIEQELSRLENRALLERKKLKLQRLEEFVHHSVDEVMRSIRSAPRYRQFLLDTVREAVGRIPAGGEVCLHPEDIAFEAEIRAAIQNQTIVIKADNTLTWGGCLVFDTQVGRVFNGTIERRYYRRAQEIRRGVVQILEKAQTPHPP